MGSKRREGGQTTVEFALIGLILLMLTVGLVDVGRAFYQYNAVSVAARYGARWGSVVGGTCSGQFRGGSSSDWCNQLNTGTTDFWNTPGNKPRQGPTDCPKKYDAVSGSNSYVASNYAGSSSTTIVGSVVHKFDTDSSLHNGIASFVLGGLTPGFDLSNMWVCIQLPTEAYSAPNWLAGPGYLVTVYVYYRFNPVGGLFGKPNLDLIGSSQYEIEGA
jgi:hypothetical protein